MDPNAHLFTALAHFKDWSNYLLVTTVAALGWVAAKPNLLTPTTLKITLVSLCASIAFAIFTLALIPLVAEAIPAANKKSIYEIRASFKPVWLWGTERELVLKAVCWWQHVLFLVGVVAFTAGAYVKAAQLAASASGAG